MAWGGSQRQRVMDMGTHPAGGREHAPSIRMGEGADRQPTNQRAENGIVGRVGQPLGNRLTNLVA
jgi:hypothetical protein